MPASSHLVPVSVIINTNGRAESLSSVIDSFRHISYPELELCVVYGPTEDGTAELLENFATAGEIKIAPCPFLNLSSSRNIGIALASGDVVAFIDDDAIPEPDWLDQIVVPLGEHQVAAAGGFVFDATGFQYQYRYSDCDRLGNCRWDLSAPSAEYNFPFSNHFPYVQGTNSAFKRQNLVEIGGFDEEYEFYLDETDVCCRLIDAGFYIRQLPNAAVHHKSMSSLIRNDYGVTIYKYAVIKNKIYFSLINNHGHFSLKEVIADSLQFIERHRVELNIHVQSGKADASILEQFEDDIDRALETGLIRGMSGTRRTRPAAFFEKNTEFLPFPALSPVGPRRTIVFFSQTYPPHHAGGNGRHTHDIAQAISNFGHTVHVFTRGTELNRVSFEDGIWVHRLIPKQQTPRSLGNGTAAPQRIWDYSATLLEELYRLSSYRRIDVVEGVSWDAECLAVVLDGRFPSATNLVTTLDHWLDTHGDLKKQEDWFDGFARPMLSVERYLFEHTPAIIAASRAIVQSVEARYNVSLTPGCVAYLPHGLADVSKLERRSPNGWAEPRPSVGPRVLFVGRLELRKGIDVVLAAAPILFERHPDLVFWIAGDDTLVVDGGQTFKEQFLNSVAASVAERITFFGHVDDRELRWLYDNCDVFVSPSRFESFGLTFVEAMMFGKPSIGSSAGGIPEVIQNGEYGLLVPPGDTTSLTLALDQLVRDPTLRDRMGSAARRAYEMRFESSLVAREHLAFLDMLVREPISWERIFQNGYISVVDVGYGQTAHSLGEDAEIHFEVNRQVIHVTFWKHVWSGIAEVSTRDRSLEIDLYAPDACFETVTLRVSDCSKATIFVRRTGRKSEVAKGSEVIVYAIQESGLICTAQTAHTCQVTFEATA